MHHSPLGCRNVRGNKENTMKVYTEPVSLGIMAEAFEAFELAELFGTWSEYRKAKRLLAVEGEIRRMAKFLKLDKAEVSQMWEDASIDFYESGAYMEWDDEGLADQWTHTVYTMWWFLKRKLADYHCLNWHSEEQTDDVDYNFNSTCPDGDEAELPF